MFVLLVELDAAQNRAKELEELLLSLIGVAEHEPGILFYAVQRPQGDHNKFVLYECYEDKAAWEAHLQYEPTKRLLSGLEPLLQAPPKLTLCDAIATTSRLYPGLEKIALPRTAGRVRT